MPRDARRFARVVGWCIGLVAMCMSSEARAAEPIRIFAAASLTDVLSAAMIDFEKTAPSARVVAQFGGSSDLARQIIAGAPADLFFSADTHQLDRVVARGLIDKDATADVLSNQLVVVVPDVAQIRLREAKDLAGLERVAMADPAAVPAGVYARQYLERLGLWETLRARVVPTLDVRGALAAVASGNVPAGFVYRTDAALEPRVETALVVPVDEGPRILYSLGVVRQRDRPPVRALYDYLRSQAAGAVFARNGFIVLERAP